MTDVNVNTATNNTRKGEQVALLAHQLWALLLRYPRRVAWVVAALFWLSMLAWLGRGWVLVSGIVGALGMYVRRRVRQPEPDPEPEPEPLPGWHPEDWFEDVCRRARIPIPLVKSHWPTKQGYAYRLIITEWVEREGRPMTVDAWLSYKALLRDVVGLGCRVVTGEPDPDHGGVTTIEFHGVHFPGWEMADDGLWCDWQDCETEATLHVLLSDELGCVLSCAAHASSYNAYRPIDRHVASKLCPQEGWWVRSEPGKQGRCSDTPPPPTAPLPAEQEPIRECTPDLEPLSPQDILPIFDREGRGALPPPDPATRRPPGALPGTKAGDLFDALVAAGGPLARGRLAELSRLDPGYAVKLLTGWAEVGACRKVAGAWEFVTSYRTSGSVTPDGNEEAASD